jgi:hypothetical protein
MPSLMVQSATIRNLNNLCDEGSEKPLDFTMSKYKASSPMRHPLYQQFFGNNEERNEEQGKVLN